MTFEEKREAIRKYCIQRTLCTAGEYECPLYRQSGRCYDTNDEDIINKNFELISAMPDYKAPPNSNETVSTVEHPSHYNQGNIECIDAMVAAYGKEAVSVFCLLNAFKYLWRNEHKNGKEDLEKAIWYLKKRLELIENE